MDNERMKALLAKLQSGEISQEEKLALMQTVNSNLEEMEKWLKTFSKNNE